MKEMTGHLIERFGADLLTQIQIPPRGDDQDAARRQLAGTLAAAAGGDREVLEQLRAGFIRRLHRVSDDFAATAGLRVTEAALALVPRLEGVWAWGHREPTKPRGRWWRRLR
jgi:hypothetical protein